MKTNRAPDIHVGILLAEQVRFFLEGDFVVVGTGISCSGRAEAGILDDSVSVVCQGHEHLAGRELVFMPVEPDDPVEAGSQQASGSFRDAGAASGTSFTISDVVIGIGFHWEQKEEQRFRGGLKMVIEEGRVRVINIISLEEYLVSVISSEMRADSAAALLRAHTIISRSWLLAQIDKQQQLQDQHEGYRLEHETEDEYIRWYDREDHELFHVCADDHCQRYQGVTRALNPEVASAVNGTTGEVLTHEGRICDARFSKCCGGVSEQFEYCWEPVEHPYLKRVDDNPVEAPVNYGDLKHEETAAAFIRSSPPAFCNTVDVALLRQVLNDYDQASEDFYRWKVTCEQEELAELIRSKSGRDFGRIKELVPIQRGESGRLVRLKIVGTELTLTVGKELEIRRWLSPTHLYSSAFVVEYGPLNEGVPESFTLLGAGWGHGVGLCQIGAAVMASRGYSHEEILQHYFVGASIEKRYESN